jgi:hypothetical protein
VTAEQQNSAARWQPTPLRVIDANAPLTPTVVSGEAGYQEIVEATKAQISGIADVFAHWSAESQNIRQLADQEAFDGFRKATEKLVDQVSQQMAQLTGIVAANAAVRAHQRAKDRLNGRY